MITIYAKLAGIMQARESRSLGFAGLTDDNRALVRKHLGTLL